MFMCTSELFARREVPRTRRRVLSLNCVGALYYRYLELQSSGRRDEVRLHYVEAGGVTARVETFPFRLADGAWHRVALAVSGAQATLLVDCHPLYRRLIPPPDRNFTQPQLSLWVGQRNSKHSLFKVSVYIIRLVLNVCYILCCNIKCGKYKIKYSGNPSRC